MTSHTAGQTTTVHTHMPAHMQEQTHGNDSCNAGMFEGVKGTLTFLASTSHFTCDACFHSHSKKKVKDLLGC